MSSNHNHQRQKRVAVSIDELNPAVLRVGDIFIIDSDHVSLSDVKIRAESIGKSFSMKFSVSTHVPNIDFYEIRRTH